MPVQFDNDPAQTIDLDGLERHIQRPTESADQSKNESVKSQDGNFTTERCEDASSHSRKADDRLAQMDTYDRYEITEEDCYPELGFSFTTWKKWYIVSVVFWIQISMNFNTSLYSNALGGISEEFGVSMQAARCGAMVFLVAYAFGCELWVPWSEEFGRWPVLQVSLFLVNIWQLPVALAPNFATIMVGRALCGISTAGGSITFGMIADMWEANDQQYAVAYVVFASVFGSVLGPIVGGFCEAYLDWR
ncbi:MFS transporter [Hortaea werneckii]|nr:MFS transporter [Hortaea werneckii]